MPHHQRHPNIDHGGCGHQQQGVSKAGGLQEDNTQRFDSLPIFVLSQSSCILCVYSLPTRHSDVWRSAGELSQTQWTAHTCRGSTLAKSHKWVGRPFLHTKCTRMFPHTPVPIEPQAKHAACWCTTIWVGCCYTLHRDALSSRHPPPPHTHIPYCLPLTTISCRDAP